jgi:hypothetical protein
MAHFFLQRIFCGKSIYGPAGMARSARMASALPRLPSGIVKPFQKAE